MSQPSHLQLLVQDLLKPQAYPEHPPQVALLETHISYLFLTGTHVYKVKKPVNLGFLDFTTLRKRHHYCQQEVLLNRRLSPDIYLGVVKITLGPEGCTLGEKGKAVEYAVRMLQLPQEKALSRLLDTDQVTPSMMEQLARRIAHFHSQAETSPRITRVGGWPTVRHNVLENFLQTERYVDTAIPRSAYLDLKGYSQAFLEVCRILFKRREQEQKIRDTHGDLHTAQIWFVNGIEITDCIEFNQRFRYGD
ncbi:MAG: hypothetical protein HY676_01240, partial [Chloroflexi bacterium]|nr:hypothetical protein [Chloroflexota bacterium]